MMYKILLLSIVIFVQACTTAPRIDKSNSFTNSSNANLNIGQVTTYHYGSKTGKVFGALTGGLIGMALGEAIANSDAPVSYEESLTMECKKGILNTINASELFAITDNNSELRLDFHIRFESVANTIFEVSPVAMVIEWNLYNESTEELMIEARTIVQANNGSDSLPNTKDPKYFDEYVALAIKNADDFLALINYQEPIWGKDSLTLTQ